jgi:hypothetical protein
MIIFTHPYSISEIFSNENIRFYTIPKYQRAYTWGQKEWNLLFDDIIDNDDGYFLGSIICIARDKAGMATSATLEVIDGQQRMTTISLLLAALYSKLLPYKKEDELSDDQMADFIALKKRLVKEKEKIPTAVLTLQNQNQNCDDYFCLLCNELKLLKDKPKIAYMGNRKIYTAYRYFISKIDEKIAELQEENPELDLIDAYFGLVKKFCSAVLVSIEVGNNKDAYMLFESLNNRGVPLSAMDLIKNCVIAKADNGGKIDECHEQWLRIIDNLTDEVNVQERFFRQYYNAFRDELNGEQPVEGKGKYRLGAALATKTTLLDLYEHMINDGLEIFLNNLERESQNYALLINHDENANEETKKALLNLERIQGAPSYISLLYILSKKKELDVSNELFIKIVNFLIKFFVRRNITDTPNTNKLTKIFMNLNNSLKEKKGNEVYEEIKKTLTSQSASNQKFEEKLRGPVYDENTDAARFLLCFYEEKFNTKEHLVDLWCQENKKYVWTIEHIFPEGSNIPKHWVDMIGEGDCSKAKEYQDKYVHTLGNLTITGYNSNLGNMAFDKKKNRQKDGKDIGYKNGLKLNEDVVSEDSWTIQKIMDRTDKLVAEFMKDFDLNAKE